jgi:choline kinase
MWLARDLVKNGMIFLNADILFHVNILKNLLLSKHENSVVVDPDKTFGSKNPVVVHLDEQGNIDALAHQSDIGDDWYGVAFGIYKLSQEVSSEYFRLAGEFFREGPKKGGFFFPLQDIVERIPIFPSSTDIYPWASINTLEEFERAKSKIAGIKI